MKLRVLTVGKPRLEETGTLYERYVARIERLGVSCEDAWVPEVRADGRFSDDHVREREARSILDRLDGKAGRGRRGSGRHGTVVALDPGGEQLDSPGLARRIERWATPEATLILGGPLGLHGSVTQHADVAWSLSRLTLPHELARVVAVEQIYRALTILKCLPYHK